MVVPDSDTQDSSECPRFQQYTHPTTLWLKLQGARGACRWFFPKEERLGRQLFPVWGDSTVRLCVSGYPLVSRNDGPDVSMSTLQGDPREEPPTATPEPAEVEEIPRPALET